MTSADRSALLAEFVGTGLLLVAVVGSGIASADAGSESAQLLQHALIVALALIGLVSAFVRTSGAHFNPAVTIADTVLGRRGWRSAGRYIAVQCLGAVVGVLVANVLFGADVLALSDKVRSGPRLISSEAFATFALVLVIFATARTEQVRNIALVVGATVGALIFATPSTALMNPAVTFARVLTDTWTGVRLVDAVPFVLAQVAGAVVAVAVVRSTADRAKASTAPT